MTSHSEFNGSTTSSAVVQAFSSSVKDKVILVTGVNAGGIGGETARALATQAPKLLILTGRSTSKIQIVIDEIHETQPEVECRAVACELSSFATVRKAVEDINALTDTIDVVINNAAIMAMETRELSPDGIELQFATNHVGHFLLTNLILPKLINAAKRAPAGAVRVVNVSSYGHAFSPLRFSDLKWEKFNTDLPESERPNSAVLHMFEMLPSADAKYKYNSVASYGNSKTANILFSLGLNKRLAKHGVASFALHPGSIVTELTRNMNPEAYQEARKRAAESGILAQKTLSEGASTQLVAALDPNLKVEGTNVYLDDCQLVEANPWARDEQSAEKLWTVSEELVGEKFTF